VNASTATQSGLCEPRLVLVLVGHCDRNGGSVASTVAVRNLHGDVVDIVDTHGCCYGSQGIHEVAGHGKQRAMLTGLLKEP
jgi:predicted aconitase with swiveling domain